MTNRNHIGIKGEECVKNLLIEKSFKHLTSNLKRIGCEFDLIMYTLDTKRHYIVVKVIEVKTRKSGYVDIGDLGIEKKFHRFKTNMEMILTYIKTYFLNTYGITNVYIHLEFDLAVVNYDKDTYQVSNYINNVNLLI